LNYKSYGQAEIAYRLGDPAIDDGKTLSVFSRIFAGNGSQNASLPIYAPVLSAGLRWKPFSNQVINLSVEEQIPLDQGQSPPTNTLLRVSASFFNSGKYSDEWHPAAQGWLAQNLYLDAAYYIVNKLSSLTADYRLSYHNRLGESQTIEPYSHIQWNSLNQQTQPDVRAGFGVRWNIWGNESHYNAFASKISVGLEFQYAISTYLSDKSTVLLTFGGRW
jgi:adsorption protein A